ncbi:MAG TPA: RluA family pseudouridine synthase [Thermoanaerobaculia bacterium]|nr:RluA family pseudouridine synthase [Thermoanaerobaculia bacterium]
MRKQIEQGQRLLDALAELFPDSSRTTNRQLLRSGRVRVNGASASDARQELRKGDLIDVAPRAVQQNLSPELNLLFEDEHLLVVVKASGLLTVATPTEKVETAQAHLNAYMRSQRGERVHVVHRLDRACSGVMLFAKSFDIREMLKEQFAEHDIDRVYVAIIEGSMPAGSGTIRSFLVEEQNYKVRSTESATLGKLAVTHYRTVKSGPRYSMLEITLETGRKNQIRVHLSEAGHPILGDDAYGSKADPISRLALHARLLGFVHPVTGEKLQFESPLPAPFQSLSL